MTNESIHDLIERLIEIGRKEVADSRSSSHFLDEARAETEEIGQRLNELGGVDGLELMQTAHATVQSRLGGIPARELEAAWGGIGEWQS
jgi:hypothetical protein